MNEELRTLIKKGLKYLRAGDYVKAIPVLEDSLKQFLKTKISSDHLKELAQLCQNLLQAYLGDGRLFIAKYFCETNFLEASIPVEDQQVRFRMIFANAYHNEFINRIEAHALLIYNFLRNILEAFVAYNPPYWQETIKRLYYDLSKYFLRSVSTDCSFFTDAAFMAFNRLVKKTYPNFRPDLKQSLEKAKKIFELVHSDKALANYRDSLRYKKLAKENYYQSLESLLDKPALNYSTLLTNYEGLASLYAAGTSENTFSHLFHECIASINDTSVLKRFKEKVVEIESSSNSFNKSFLKQFIAIASSEELMKLLPENIFLPQLKTILHETNLGETKQVAQETKSTNESAFFVIPDETCFYGLEKLLEVVDGLCKQRTLLQIQQIKRRHYPLEDGPSSSAVAIQTSDEVFQNQMLFFKSVKEEKLVQSIPLVQTAETKKIPDSLPEINRTKSAFSGRICGLRPAALQRSCSADSSKRQERQKPQALFLLPCLTA